MLNRIRRHFIMEYENEKGYKGRATAGMALGIVGTALGLSNAQNNGCNNGCGNNGGLLGGLFGGNRNCGCNNGATVAVSALEAEIAELKAMRYTDGVSQEIYKAIVGVSNAEDAKIQSLQKELFSFAIDIDKKVALNALATESNRAYDQLARDCGFKLLDAKLECCCDKANARMTCDNEKQAMADAAIISYVNSNFVPGVLKLAITSICPQPAPACSPVIPPISVKLVGKNED